MYISCEHLRLCRRNGVHGAPDLVVEILSPSTEHRDRRVKLESFRQAEVAHVWLIDPETPRGVEEYVLIPSGHYEVRMFAAPDRWSPAISPGWTLPLAEAQAEITLPKESEPDAENPEAAGET